MATARSIKGLVVAPGLAMGPVHVVRATPDVIPTWSIREGEVASEVERLHRALAAVDERLELQRKTVAAQANEQDAEIFAVHRMILQDPGALQRVETRIREQRINAEACVQELVKHLEQTLGGLAGDNLRGYGADVSDPWRTVIAELMSSENEEFRSGDEKFVIAAAELTPYAVTLLDRDRVLGVIAETGGRYSHGAVLARSFGFPCVVELPNLLSRLEQGMRVIVDADRGVIQLRPEQSDVDLFLEHQRRRAARTEQLAVHATLPAITTDGHPFGVQVNVESLRDLDTFEIANTDGVGLLRTEFLYMERNEFPSEEEQYRLYRRALERMEGRELTLRTLDIGGDKQLPYFKTPHETNPALGWRGLRVVLEWQDLLRVQLRAALRASAHGNLRLLLPMVTSLEEVREVRRIVEGVREQLDEHGYEMAPSLPLGVMIEVPSTLFVLEDMLPEVDFISVGTNDMVQYLLATDRDNPWVARLYDPLHPAVWRALERVARLTREAGVPSSVCGEMAGDLATTVLLLGLGFSSVSVAPNFLAEVKFAVRHVSLAEAAALARRTAGLGTSAALRELLAEIRTCLHAPGGEAGAPGSPPGGGASEGSGRGGPG